MSLPALAAPKDGRGGGGAGGETVEPSRDAGGGRGEPGERPEWVDGQIIVRFVDGTPEAEQERVRRRHGLERVRSLRAPQSEVDRTPQRAFPPEAAERVASEPSVLYAEPNYLWYPAGDPTSEPLFGELWGLHDDGSAHGHLDGDANAAAGNDIRAPEAWAVSGDASGQVVAVIDTGVDISHPDLAGRIWINEAEASGVSGIDDDGNGLVDDVNGWDFFNGNPSVFDEPEMDDHGTHVAGTIAAAWDGAGVAGVSQAKILPLKFLGPGGGDTGDAADAIDYAISLKEDKGVDIRVLNNSWGGGGASSTLSDAIERANAAGMLFVAAAGNGGSDGVGDDNDAIPHYPSNYTNANVLSVAATDNDDGLASFSNFGDVSVDLGAPGVNVLSTVPQFAKAVLVDPSTGASYHSGLFAFGLEGVVGAAARSSLVDATLVDWLGVTPGSDTVLLVDDNSAAGNTSKTVWEAVLGDLGIAFDGFTVTTMGNPADRQPSAALMATYDAVVWFTGNDTATLTAESRSELTDYLTTGAGKVALFGLDIAWDLTDEGTVTSTFLRDVLKADFLADTDVNFRPEGVAGTAFAGVGPLDLLPSSTGDGQFWTDALIPRSGAVAGMRGWEWTWFNGTSMATPHVSGAAALVASAFPGLSPSGLKTQLMTTGEGVSSLVGKTVCECRLDLAAALPATFDTSFGTEGRVTTDVGAVVGGGGSTTDVAFDVAVDGDGKVVTTGVSQAAGFASSDLAVARHTSAGALDTGFGTGGAFVHDLGGSEFATSMAIDASDRIVVAGYGPGSSDTDFVVLRLLPDGTLDPGFGAGGVTTIDFGHGADHAHGVAVDSNGRVVVAGSVRGPTGWDVGLARLTSAGALDVTFGSAGTVTVDIAGASQFGYDVLVDASDRPVLAASTSDGGNIGALVIRLEDDGDLDPTFSADGWIRLDAGPGTDIAYAVALDGSDIVIGGTSYSGSSYDLLLARLDASGTPDGSFGSGGIRTDARGGTDEAATDVGVGSTGVIYASGYERTSPGASRATVTRYTPSTGFARVVLDLGGTSTGRAIALDGDKPVLAGDSGASSPEDFAVARLG